MSSSRRSDYKKSGAVTRKAPQRAPVGSNRKMLVVPGVTRTGGAYERALLARYGGEGKFVDFTVNQTTPTNAAKFLNTGIIIKWTNLAGTNMTSLTQVAQGTSVSQRIGNKIRPYQIRLRGSVDMWSTHPCYFRILLVQDNQANGALPQMTDLFNMNTSNQAINAFYNMDNVARFKFLKDKTFQFTPLATQITSADQSIAQRYRMPIKLNHKLKGNPTMEYSGTTGEITEVRSINYFFVIISSRPSGTIVSADPEVEGHVRFYYKE